jgi:hypothetical protein
LQIDFLKKERRKERKEGKEKRQRRGQGNGGERESLHILKDVQAWELPTYWRTCTSCFTVGDVAIAGDVSALAPLDSITTVLITVFCQLWCWNPAETADVPEADGQRPSGPPQ